MEIYQLTSEDLSDVGRQGGSSQMRFNKFFTTVEFAKEFAERDYGKPINWKGNISGDLGWVMYKIAKIEIEG